MQIEAASIPIVDDEISDLFRALVAKLVNKTVASALAAYLTKSRFSMMP